MLHLKCLLFGIILLSSFGSAFAEDYDPKQDVFDLIISTLVPTLIIFLYDTKETKDEKKSEANRESESELEANNKSRQKLPILNKIRQGLSHVKIKRAFDDFLFLLSLFVLPCIVLYKHHKEFAIPIWIPILFGVTAGFVFFIIISHYIISYSDIVLNDWGIELGLLGLFIDFSHVISDICFIFYTKSISENNFTYVFIYLHAVTGILGSVLLLPYICLGILFILRKILDLFSSKFEPNLDLFFYLLVRVEPILRKLDITLTFIWTPIVQMLNMSLFSGNDYYWMKLILALNLIYFSRVINYAEKNVQISIVDNVPFGMLYIVFYVLRNYKWPENC
ncbi:hypothetical protein RhiirA5_481695 [Rhizophagus irregularis]|uniref:Uncharacterized protein n=1 Tax=Rhizophagus irregularis TaxID=588596 RepID=A0A2I1ED30_9GLOM|nr:hypothetical protein RhiirA5_481695 [Rhizophagus irregularis]PKC72950.1 hypothetical protein RhiirA1_488964 [Rhizophagus irregularis]PKY20038.1 hypothetical protein RhiirB3_496580 [Rhizophagus irregularis]CAB5192773.1 unnamed protein product [Rhizophagus irregularis]